MWIRIFTGESSRYDDDVMLLLLSCGVIMLGMYTYTVPSTNTTVTMSTNIGYVRRLQCRLAISYFDLPVIGVVAFVQVDCETSAEGVLCRYICTLLSSLVSESGIQRRIAVVVRLRNVYVLH
jgi:hypothetical protein